MNTLKTIIMGIVIACVVATPLIAEIYTIPDALMKEVRDNKTRYEASPESGEAMFDLAMSYAYTGQIRLGWGVLKKMDEEYARKVVALYEPTVMNEETDWKMPFRLAFGYFFIKEKKKSVAMFEVARARNPDNVWILGFLALVKGEMGHVDEAMALCKKALKMEPNATGIHFLLAEGYRKKGKYLKFMSHMMVVGRLETEEVIRRKK